MWKGVRIHVGTPACVQTTALLAVLRVSLPAAPPGETRECRTIHLPHPQPSWSAFREPSFGHGRLVFNSPTEAKWQWIRNQHGGDVSDDVTITRKTSGC